MLREIIEKQVIINQSFSGALNEFLELAREAINPKVEMANVREMIIQHVLAEDIFMRVFADLNIRAKQIRCQAASFFTLNTGYSVL